MLHPNRPWTTRFCVADDRGGRGKQRLRKIYSTRGGDERHPACGTELQYYANRVTATRYFSLSLSVSTCRLSPLPFGSTHRRRRPPPPLLHHHDDRNRTTSKHRSIPLLRWLCRYACILSVRIRCRLTHSLPPIVPFHYIPVTRKHRITQ